MTKKTVKESASKSVRKSLRVSVAKKPAVKASREVKTISSGGRRVTRSMKG